MSSKIHDWNDIQKNYDGAILLGNGASIAVDKKFKYRSLKEYATDEDLLTEDVKRVFEFFETDDFELILRIIWQATNVNRSLDIKDDKTEEAYSQIRDCLISAVRGIHPEHSDIAEELPRIYEFLKQFKMVISLNYDLIVYWVMRYGAAKESSHAFKDCFIDTQFNENWENFKELIGNQKSCTLVFYPHGNLILARDKIENECKISSDGLSLLKAILSKWEKGSYVPLFVSEGNTKQKLKSIKSSYYLNTVYREVLKNMPDNLVIYGWGMGEHDMHIVKRIAQSSIARVAVSVFNDNQDYCNSVSKIFKNVFHKECKKECKIEFFNSQSKDCWNRGS